MSVPSWLEPGPNQPIRQSSPVVLQLVMSHHWPDPGGRSTRPEVQSVCCQERASAVRELRVNVMGPSLSGNFPRYHNGTLAESPGWRIPGVAPEPSPMNSVVLVSPAGMSFPLPKPPKRIRSQDDDDDEEEST